MSLRSRRDSRGHREVMQTPALRSVPGFTSAPSQHTHPAGPQHRSSRKRAHGEEQPPRHTDNDLFWHKCSELQGYLQPLSSILRGLRSGRYSQRLSSFQESVAMDRIQRILGVLQNPHLGGRFLGIILKLEEMLHSWFPHVKPGLPSPDDNTTPKKQTQHHHSASSPPSTAAPLCSSDVESTPSFSSAHLRRLHTSPGSSLKTAQSALGPPAPSAVTQDHAVSSSTDSHSRRLRRLSSQPHRCQEPLPFKISSPCLERLLQANAVLPPSPDPEDPTRP